jgi:hypothetical protein
LKIEELEKANDLTPFRVWLLKLVKASTQMNEALSSEIIDDVIHWRSKMRNYETALNELTKIEKEN